MSLTPFVYVDMPLTSVEPGTVVTVSDDTAKHVTTVLRLKPGMPVVLSDGAGVVVGATVAGPNTLTLTSLPQSVAAETPAITLVQAVPKLRKLETVVRLATEAGVHTVLPVITARSQASVKDLAEAKLVTRLEAIAHAAGEQSRRAHRLNLANAVPFTGLFETLAGRPLLLVDGTGAGFHDTVDELRGQIDTTGQLALAIGPEGGFTPDELTAARQAGARVARLGQSVLRSEHAGVSAVSAAAVLLGRFDRPVG